MAPGCQGLWDQGGMPWGQCQGEMLENVGKGIQISKTEELGVGMMNGKKGDRKMWS